MASRHLPCRRRGTIDRDANSVRWTLSRASAEKQCAPVTAFFLSANKRIKCMTVISVIVGSTREGRFSEKPARWILQHLKKRDGVDARFLDLRDFPMPFFDQPATPAIPGRTHNENEGMDI